MLIAPWLDALFELYTADFLLARLIQSLTILVIAILMARQGRRATHYIFGGTIQRFRFVTPQRARTMEALLTSLWVFLTYTFAIIAVLGLYIPATALWPAVGLFSAGFGLGARPLVSDYLTGITLIFEYPFGVGDKVELNEIHGVVEAVNLRTTTLRSMTGELYVIPNGDIRVIRNFSRAAFSPASVHIAIPTHELDRALPILEQLAAQLSEVLPGELIEPPQVVSETGEMGTTTTLTIVAKASFAHGAGVRRRLLEMVNERLETAGILKESES